MEIKSVKSVEVHKQDLMSFEDFSMLEIFRHVDQFAHGNVNSDNLRVYLKNFDFCADLQEEDIHNWIRKYDRDVDMRLDFSDFVKAMGPFCNYNRKAKGVEETKQEQVDQSIMMRSEDMNTMMDMSLDE